MTQPLKADNIEIQDSILRHVVLFKFKEGTTKSEIATVEEAFNALPNKIKAIYSYEWGLNNSPEGLNKGFTHCYLLTFKTEEDRGIYLPHPDHKAFGAILTPYLEDVLVVDYWTRQ
nr:Dabb family protein [Sediminicola sp. YIK13]